MNRCVIITSYHASSLKESLEFKTDDFIICADGGYSFAIAAGIVPNVVIGDFDSLQEEITGNCQVIRVPVEKDDTDTLICLKFGIEKGYDEFIIAGGLGGRLDHTVANLQAMSHAVDQKKSIWVVDGKNRATLRNPGEIAVQRIEGLKLSLFSFTEVCNDVTIKGVKYPLNNAMLHNSFPIGVSNEFLEDSAIICHSSGKLLIIMSQD